jgi:murein DD-endopeptidase MepM/ murein hydrolase activator NlpD
VAHRPLLLIMGRRDEWVLALLALAVLFGRRRGAQLPRKGWAWPMASLVLDGNVTIPPVISNGWHPPHLGVDLMYRRDAFPGGTGLAFPPGSTNGTDHFICPPATPVVAARDGIVHRTGTSSRGHYVVLTHKRIGTAPLYTFYQHLETVRTQLPVVIKPGVQVPAGTVLGTAGFDPSGLDHAFTRHEHFEIWVGGEGEAHAVDPTEVLSTARYARTWRLKTS